jgi:predicted glycogen debranching enzyme
MDQRFKIVKKIVLDQSTCGNLDASIGLEWLCTNGRGGYACGAVAGVNTRKYHGYLVAAARPPLDRFVLLARVEDRIWIGPRSYALSTNEFPDVIDPQGYRNMIGFELRAGPVWRYCCGDALIEKSIVLAHGQEAVVVRYELLRPPTSSQEVRLLVQPMLAGRHFHATTGPGNRPDWRLDTESGRSVSLLLSAPQCPLRLFISHNAQRFSDGQCWWYNFILREEKSRGYPDHDDLWTPGALEFTLRMGRPVGLVAATRPVPFVEHAELILKARAREEQLSARLDDSSFAAGLVNRLSVAADDFLVQHLEKPGHEKSSVIAGYPWFEDWGRDTFISLAGLTLVTRNYAAARSILVSFADHIRDGLVPNRFPDAADAPDYNTVDASLWFIHAAYQYWRYSDDLALLRDYLYAPLGRIIECYRQGTLYGIRMDADGLIRAGVPGVQLTWMDAKIGDRVVTPRYGKPVEVNALWYNALHIMALVAGAAGDGARAADFLGLARLAGRSFLDKFWNTAGNCLFDVIGDDGAPDASLRPNQLLAVSLPFSPLPLDKTRQTLAVVRDKLLTPLGLRTLAPNSPDYQGRYVGDQNSRDRAYHQGTVWPWLFGPFVTAFVRAYGATPEIRRQAWEFIQPLEGHLLQAGLGSISEIADGDPPHQPRGCIAQAWSVAEVLRCCWEDVLGRAPAWPHERLRNGAADIQAAAAATAAAETAAGA